MLKPFASGRVRSRFRPQAKETYACISKAFQHDTWKANRRSTWDAELMISTAWTQVPTEVASGVIILDGQAICPDNAVLDHVFELVDALESSLPPDCTAGKCVEGSCVSSCLHPVHSSGRDSLPLPSRLLRCFKGHWPGGCLFWGLGTLNPK